ncbi:MAG: phospho-N-acetylmuramoyl-pentapeptide-transferase [Ruminococcaceae bacterium]|nr:phospho-N-acetylmuramoyl-pentapeptide-transferase [Oscillospiraceae bacterium]
MTTKLTIAFLVTFAGAVLLAPFYIPLLRRLKFGQTIRYNGPQTHLKKQGTPTIGALIFITPLIIVSLVLYFTDIAPQIIPLLWTTVGFAFVGFLDDLIKIIKKSKDGLKPYQKMTLLFIVSLAFVFYITQKKYVDNSIILQFFGLNVSLNLSWVFIPFCVLILLSSTNAVNLTDGLDGLCAGSSFIVFMLFAAISILLCPNDSVAYFTVAMAGGLLGFLLFNANPAKVFMGDTGSLAIGGAIGACAIMLQRPLIILIAGAIFVIEALSVILQVGFFKITKGKRLFRMAPIHHHFELCGWSERKVVVVFWLFTLACCVLTFFSIK